MLVLLIVISAVVLLAVVLSVGGGFGGYGGPTVHRRIIYRRPSRRIITEHRLVDHTVDDPADYPAVDDRSGGPVYRP